jgi:dCTP deaminase
MNGGILTGHEIKRQMGLGAIRISPFDPEQVAQASVDLHLYPELAVYQGTYQPTGNPRCPCRPCTQGDCSGLYLAEPAEVDRFRIPSAGLWLMPGVFYLGATIERVWSDRFALVLDGKSSPGRKGLKVHFTAGYIEPGFDGQVTLEIEVSVPLRVHTGWPVAQLRFHPLVGKVESYADRGHYRGALAEGPVPSLSHLHKPRHVGTPR